MTATAVAVEDDCDRRLGGAKTETFSCLLFFFQVGEEEEERKNKRERFSGVLYLGGFYYLVKEGFVYLYKKIVKFSENGKVIIMIGSNHT